MEYQLEQFFLIFTDTESTFQVTLSRDLALLLGCDIALKMLYENISLGISE